MIKKNQTLLDIINNNRVLHLLDPNIDDEFPGGGGSGGDGSGTTSGNTVPSLSISPNTDQSIAIGTTLCFTASGNIGFPLEGEQATNFNGGCSATSSGTWIKNCGTNGAFDAEAYDTKPIYRKRPFQITATNSSFANPGVPLNNSHLLLGVKSTGGYVFFWEVFRYCGASPSCSPKWIGSIKMTSPNGTQTTFATGYVEFKQQFRIRSDGNRLSWDYTTENNWVYNRYYIDIPEDTGDFQFIVNGLFLGNTWTNIKSFKGSYQATPEADDFIWTSDCIDSLVVTGNKACYTPIISGHCKICVSVMTLDPKCVSVVATPLTLTPLNAECRTCGDSEDCENIPAPTQPVVSIIPLDVDSIKVDWEDSISLTSGLFYEVSVNNFVETTLDNTIILNSLTDGEYSISVRAIDACGVSEWTDPQVYEIDTISERPIGPDKFTLTEVPYTGDKQSDLISYQATWDEVEDAVLYEIWAGDPQSYLYAETEDLFYDFLSLPSGLKLSVRAKDAMDNYTQFSTIVEVP